MNICAEVGFWVYECFDFPNLKVILPLLWQLLGITSIVIICANIHNYIPVIMLPINGKTIHSGLFHSISIILIIYLKKVIFLKLLFGELRFLVTNFRYYLEFDNFLNYFLPTWVSILSVAPRDEYEHRWQCSNML